jgi:hypothetical protein
MTYEDGEKDYSFLLGKICNRALRIHKNSTPIPYIPPKRNLLFKIKKFFKLLFIECV